MIVDEWFMQMWEGNSVAWLGFGLMIALIMAVVAEVFLWWKTPQPAKRMTLNNIFGGAKPNVFNAYDDQTVRVENPTLFREGFMYNKKNKSWYFVPRNSDMENAVAEDMPNHELITKAFRIEGAPGAMFLAYSGKGTLMNPALLAILEQERLLHSANSDKTDSKQEDCIRVNKESWIKALQKIPDKEIIVDPVYTTSLLDPRKIVEILPKAYTKSRLASLEFKVREMARQAYEGMGNKGIMVLLILVLVLQIASLAKGFNLF